MIERYPNYQQWIDLMTQRDQGIMMVIVVAAVAFMLLYEGRHLGPVALGIVRGVLALGFVLLLGMAGAGAVGGIIR